MDQKPPQAPEGQNQTPATGDASHGLPPAPTTPPAPVPGGQPPAGESHETHTPTPENHAPESHDAPTSPAPAATPAPGASASNPADGGHVTGGMTPPPASPEHPHEVQPGKSKTMMYAVITLVVVVIGAVIVTFMAGNSQKAPEPQPQAQTVEKQQVVPPTEAPTTIPTPSTAEEQIDAVNTTENDSDLQEVDKDLQSL